MTVFFYMHVEMHRSSNLACFSLQHKRARYAIHSYAATSTRLLNGSTVVKVCGCHRLVMCMVIPGGGMRSCYKAGVRGRVRDTPCATVGLKVGHVDEAPCVNMCKKNEEEFAHKCFDWMRSS